MNEELKAENAENVPVENTTITVESKVLNPKESKMGLELSTVSDQEVAYDAALLEGKNLEELLEEASTVLVLTPKGARKKLGVVRSVFFERFTEAKDAALEIYKQDESEEKELFAFDKESIALKFKEIEDAVKQSVAEEKERIETEKLKNFNRKKELLKNLEEIVANDETLESIKQVKDIQKEWKNIRVLPKDGISELWDTYNLLQNKFYDNHSINIELKELDRQKNLEAKIDLTKKMDELHGEKSLKRSFILLNKYHEEFKNTGPVPAESREPIWEAFKKASDSVYDAKRKLYEELESEKDKVSFVRVDADSVEKLIKKDEEIPSVLSEDDEKALKEMIEVVVKKEEYSVQFESLSPTSSPFTITRAEFMRRMKEMSASGGGGMFGMGNMPEIFNIVVNGNHPLVAKILAEKDTKSQTAMIKGATDLAKLSQGLLKGEALTSFIKSRYLDLM